VKHKEHPKDPRSVPTPVTPDRCEPTPTQDTEKGRRAKPCPEGYPEEQPTDQPQKGGRGGQTGSGRPGD
jgi:hypothetical protein